MVKSKKAINQVAVLILAIFTLAGCNAAKDDKQVDFSSAANKVVLRELNYNLVQLIYNGGSEQEVKAVAKKINDISELVIIGKIISQQTTGAENPRSANYSGYFTLEV